MSGSALAVAVLESLDDDALDALAAKLAPRLLLRLTPPEGCDGWIDARAACDYLGLPQSSLWKLTAAREIPFEQDKPRGKLWFKRELLDDWREGVWKR